MEEKSIHIIGITGEAGAGKSVVLSYLKDNYPCEVLMADEIGNQVKEPGERCYDAVIRLLGEEIVREDGTLDKTLIASKIFADEVLLEQMNAIIHPAVKEYILSEIKREKENSRYDFFFVEAALLIECGYEAHVDEMWYVYASEDVRRERLKSNRGYSDEKVSQIMSGQLKEEEFRNHCQVVIDNGRDFQNTKKQIDKILGDRLWKVQKNFQDN